VVIFGGPRKVAAQ